MSMNKLKEKFLRKKRTLYEAMREELQKYGGVLRCSRCGNEKPLGDIAERLEQGWPVCCGLTMSWIVKKGELKESEK